MSSHSHIFLGNGYLVVKVLCEISPSLTIADFFREMPKKYFSSHLSIGEFKQQMGRQSVFISLLTNWELFCGNAEKIFSLTSVNFLSRFTPPSWKTFPTYPLWTFFRNGRTFFDFSSLLTFADFFCRLGKILWKVLSLIYCWIFSVLAENKSRISLPLRTCCGLFWEIVSRLSGFFEAFHLSLVNFFRFCSVCFKNIFSENRCAAHISR